MYWNIWLLKSYSYMYLWTFLVLFLKAYKKFQRTCMQSSVYKHSIFWCRLQINKAFSCFCFFDFVKRIAGCSLLYVDVNICILIIFCPRSGTHSLLQVFPSIPFILFNWNTVFLFMVLYSIWLLNLSAKLQVQNFDHISI